MILKMWYFLLKWMVTQKYVIKMGVIIKGVYYILDELYKLNCFS
jgi:hypothetical protein